MTNLEYPLQCRDLYREGILSQRPRCCPGCHLRKDFDYVTLPDGRTAQVCCTIYPELMHLVEEHVQMLREQAQHLPTDKLLYDLLTNPGPPIEPVQRAITLANTLKPPLHTPEDINAWYVYYLLKLNGIVCGNLTFRTVPLDKAVKRFAKDRRITQLEAARKLWCLFSEGLRDQDTQFFCVCYEQVKSRVSNA